MLPLHGAPLELDRDDSRQICGEEFRCNALQSIYGAPVFVSLTRPKSGAAGLQSQGPPRRLGTRWGRIRPPRSRNWPHRRARRVRPRARQSSQPTERIRLQPASALSSPAAELHRDHRVDKSSDCEQSPIYLMRSFAERRNRTLTPRNRESDGAWFPWPSGCSANRSPPSHNLTPLPDVDKRRQATHAPIRSPPQPHQAPHRTTGALLRRTALAASRRRLRPRTPRSRAGYSTA
jgi:hypothetical protein